MFRFLILEFGFIARVLREDALGQFWNQQVDEGLRALFAGVAPTRNARNDPFGNDGGIDWRQRPVKAPRRDERDTCRGRNQDPRPGGYGCVTLFTCAMVFCLAHNGRHAGHYAA